MGRSLSHLGNESFLHGIAPASLVRFLLWALLIHLRSLLPVWVLTTAATAAALATASILATTAVAAAIGAKLW